MKGQTVNPEFQPQNNTQAYLAYLNGLNIPLPEPRTAEEVLLYNLCANGVGGGGGSSAEIKDCAYLFARDSGGYASDMRVEEIEVLMPLVKKPTRATRMFYGWISKGPAEVDLSKADWSKCTDFKEMFAGNRVIKRVDMSAVDMSGVTSNSSAEDLFDASNNALEEVIGVYHKLKSGTKLRVTFRGTSSSPKPLRRFTFAEDIGLPISCYAEPFNFVYCSFHRAGMVEMFNSLPVNTQGGSYAVIKIAGNPCVVGGEFTLKSGLKTVNSYEEACALFADIPADTEIALNINNEGIHLYSQLEGALFELKRKTYPLVIAWNDTTYEAEMLTDEDRAIATNKGWTLTEV